MAPQGNIQNLKKTEFLYKNGPFLEYPSVINVGTCGICDTKDINSMLLGKCDIGRWLLGNQLVAHGNQ